MRTLGKQMVNIIGTIELTTIDALIKQMISLRTGIVEKSVASGCENAMIVGEFFEDLGIGA